MDKETLTTLESQYKEIMKLFEQGYSVEDVEEKLGLSFDGWSKFAEEMPHFYQAIEKVIKGYLNRLNKTVWKMAMGYEYEEKTITEKILPNGDVEKTITTHIRYRHPDLNACIAAGSQIKEYLETEIEIAKQLNEEKSSNSKSEKQSRVGLVRLSKKATFVKNSAS